MAAPAVLILVAAAGASRRMRGADKLLEPVAGEPVLRRLTRAAVATGQPVLVTLPEADSARAAAIAGIKAARQTVDGAEGMAASIRCGARAAGRAGAAGLLVMLADMPDIDTAALTRLIAAFASDPDRVCRAASADGQPGNPVVIPARLLAALATVTGDTGARDILRGAAVTLVPLPGQAALTDLDTPEDWAAWRQRTGL